MSLQPEKLPEIPEETARVARILFPKGNRYMWLRDELGAIYDDEQIASLYPNVGQLAEQPWRLAIMSIVQYMENYTDRQAAEALKTRIDLKYALSLELTDPGFDFSVLSEFRSRLITGALEESLLTTLLNICKERGLLKERGKQRTDSTHIEAAIRTINRVECVGETLRAALNSLAVVVPDWLRSHVPQDWYERYEKRMEEYNMPKEATKRAALIQQIGQDGFTLLKWVREEDAPVWLKEIPAVEILRKVWIQQFYIEEDKVCWRSNDNIPPSALLISSPYDIEAHMSVKRDTHWTGYKAHITETCDDNLPHLITNVKTASSTKQDMEVTDAIHQELGEKHLLPQQHYVDSGYIDSDNLVKSNKSYSVDLIGPCQENASWQTKEAQGYDSSQFSIDWDEKVVTCPEGNKSIKWKITNNARGQDVVNIDFSRYDCSDCHVRSQCTRSALHGRRLSIRPQAQYEALQTARQRQTTEKFKEEYAQRSGIEGTISQGVRAFDLRASRYLGLEKTHLQHVFIATAINVSRLFNWYMDSTPFQPRISRFAALAA